MAVLYDGAGGVFTEIGKLIGIAKNLEEFGEAGIAAAQEEAIAAVSDASMTFLDGIQGASDGLKAAIDAYRKLLCDLAAARMVGVTSIINQLHLATTDDHSVVLPRFREQMAADSKTVKQNTVTLGSVTAGANNVGNGTMIATKVLDGYNPPGAFFPADRGYAGLNSEIAAASETITVECTADSQTSGRTEGAEAWKAYGNPENPSDGTPTPYFGLGTEGSGESTASAVVGPDGSQVVDTPGFEFWTTDTPPVPSPWTIDAGVNGTNIVKESTTIYRGTYSLKLHGDGSAATIQVGQAIDPARLKPLRRYLVSVRYKSDASISAGDLLVQFTGTGYTAGASEKISIAHGSLATSWTLATFQINLPAVIPTDWKLIIQISGTMTSGKNVYVDDVYVQPMTYFGGVAVATVPGSTRYCKGDRFSFTVANDRAGAFQSFWGRYFGRQLPSAGSPNISESLAVATALQPNPPDVP